LPEVYVTGDEQQSEPTQEGEIPPQDHSYSLKIINRQQRGAGFVTESFKTGIFSTNKEIRDKIMQTLNAGKHIKDSDEIQFGYIIPGHGFKGKQHPLEESDDISGMYEAYNGKKHPIILWVKITHALSRARKRLTELSDNADTCTKKQKPNDDGDKTPRRTSYQNHLSKMAEVDCIVGDLEKKHSDGKFTPEQIRAWAHMLHLKKHTSYNDPPDKPFFRRSKSKGSSVEPQGISPAKRITLRSECIDQLDKWHKLMERGAITLDQYKDLQDTIMTDIKKY
jgi:hypothetical protein